MRDPAFAPMLATLGAAPSGAAHATEWKFDGQRATVVVEHGAVVVFTRNGMEVTRTFPELQSIAAAVGDRRMVLDGEIVALDTEGRPSFTRLQRRWPQQRRPSAELLREVPCRVMAFDVLRLDGRDTTALPYIERRELLDDVMVAKSRVLTVPAALHDVDPADALEAAALHGMEGIVVKRLDSPYRPGQRSPDWTKVPVRATCELLIAGYWCAGGPGGRSCVGSLLVAGYNPDGDLVAIGQVGTGFSATTRRRLFDQLQPIRRTTSPVANRVELSGVRFVEPCYVAEIAYREYVPGRWLRHASFKGCREVADLSQIQIPNCA